MLPKVVPRDVQGAFLSVARSTPETFKNKACLFFTPDPVSLEVSKKGVHIRPSIIGTVLIVSKKRASVISPSQNHTTIMPSSSRGGTGRIRSHQRPTDNSVPILGENLSDVGED
jgi:hypothetical protein